MSKFIFILFLLFTSLNSFGQECFSKNKVSKSDISDKKIKVKKVKIEVLNETEIDLLLNDNLCEILSIKPSDLLNEKMLKKLRANV
ncbi:hypothetical protein [Flavobacterium sp. 5]|uniref:hypothetical protein n=1 Tax=Flavobacterium sp. 5 TaxID=2035199 RepID=UPI000C2CE1C6|nr:hypothetical protein [Flavobacterium sp. 5]PKB18548.1 hypothetical protein CLU82_3827 [Flavobacterium sp. 5]